jgi:hypothetical protein
VLLSIKVSFYVILICVIRWITQKM